MTSPRQTDFEWDPEKDRSNQTKYGVSVILAQYPFAGPNRVILEDLTHSTESEKRYYCLGKVGGGILTVRFTYREHRIRTFGAGYWRKGRLTQSDINADGVVDVRDLAILGGNYELSGCQGW